MNTGHTYSVEGYLAELLTTERTQVKKVNRQIYGRKTMVLHKAVFWQKKLGKTFQASTTIFLPPYTLP